MKVLAAGWIVLLVWAGAPAVGQSEGGRAEAGSTEEAKALAAEVPPSLSAALERIADLLQQSLDMQEVGVLLRRLELAEARVAPLRADVRSAAEKVRSIEEERVILAAELQRTERALLDLDEEIAQVDERALRDQRDFTKGRLALLERQAAAARGQLYDLESRLDRERERMRALNEWVDERMGL